MVFSAISVDVDRVARHPTRSVVTSAGQTDGHFWLTPTSVRFITIL